MSASYTKFQKFVQNLTRKVFNLNSDTLKLALSNTAPSASANNQLSDITQITAANGYSSGGATVPNTSAAQSGGTVTLIGDQVVFTASGGSIGPFQYIVLYDSTASNGELIAYWDYGSAVTVTDGNTFTAKPNNSSSGGTIFTLS